MLMATSGVVDTAAVPVPPDEVGPEVTVVESPPIEELVSVVSVVAVVTLAAVPDAATEVDAVVEERTLVAAVEVVELVARQLGEVSPTAHTAEVVGAGVELGVLALQAVTKIKVNTTCQENNCEDKLFFIEANFDLEETLNFFCRPPQQVRLHALSGQAHQI